MAESSRLGRPARKTSLDCDRVLWIQVFRNFPKGISMRNRSSATFWCVAAGVLVLAIAQIAHGQTYTYSVLYGFKNNGKDPSNVYASLIVDSAGNLYGASNNGGSHNLGSVFKVTKSGTLTVLHSFTGKPDGENPQASVIRDSAGNLYGATLYGGEFNAGAVFKISPSNQETILFNSFEKIGTNGGIRMVSFETQPGIFTAPPYKAAASTVGSPSSSTPRMTSQSCTTFAQEALQTVPTVKTRST